jgi:hypothetical protein
VYQRSLAGHLKAFLVQNAEQVHGYDGENGHAKKPKRQITKHSSHSTACEFGGLWFWYRLSSTRTKECELSRNALVAVPSAMLCGIPSGSQPEKEGRRCRKTRSHSGLACLFDSIHCLRKCLVDALFSFRGW